MYRQGYPNNKNHPILLPTFNYENTQGVNHLRADKNENRPWLNAFIASQRESGGFNFPNATEKC
jgi:hypothetical protein